MRARAPLTNIPELNSSADRILWRLFETRTFGFLGTQEACRTVSYDPAALGGTPGKSGITFPNAQIVRRLLGRCLYRAFGHKVRRH